MDKRICIVIPCYNEEKSLRLDEYHEYLKTDSNSIICFVNDGSTDNTPQLIDDFTKTYPTQVFGHSLYKNSGKAEAVRQGILYCNNSFNHDLIGYLDADLSTSIFEYISLSEKITSEINFVFGSRILKVGSQIDRKMSRFLIGRLIATIISNILKIKVYDTQCGSKVFTRELAAKIFEQPFISKWLFDVEIFNRIIAIYGREKCMSKMLEVPLKKWVDIGDSKVKISYFFKLWIDLFRIYKQSKNTQFN